MSTTMQPDEEISHAITFSGPIERPITDVFRNQLAFLSQPQHDTKRLLVVFTSWGGNTFEARSLHGIIRSLAFPVEVHAVGSIKSSAVPLMLAADRRTAAPDASFMFHPWTWGIEGNHASAGLEQFPLQLEDEVKWAKATFTTRTKLTATEIDKLMLFDKPRIEGADFALKHGFVHSIGERKIPAGKMVWNIS